MLVQEKCFFFCIPLLTPDAQHFYRFNNCTFTYILGVTSAQAVAKGTNINEKADMVTMGIAGKYYSVQLSAHQVSHLNRKYPKQPTVASFSI